MNITDEVLMAYADGELDAATRNEVERALATNAEWAKQVAGYRALRTQLSNAFGSVLEEPLPERLTAAVRAQPPSAAVADLSHARASKAAKQPARRWSPANWMSIAASIALGVLLGQQMFGNRNGDWVVADQTLARALSKQLASAPATDSSVQIGVTYLSKAGDYCRSFAAAGTAAAGANAIAGLACRADNVWQIRMLMPIEPSADASYRTAASAIPTAILDRVNQEISGEPLDGEQEAAIVKRNWQTDGR